MYPVSQWLWLNSPSINEVHSRWMLKHSSEGRFWSKACRGTSIIDITANFGDILSKTCPAVCERNTWTQCFHVIYIFFFYPILFNSLQKHTFISNMCFFNTLCVKRIDCDCADKWCFQLCVRLVEHKFSELNLCLLWVGSDGLLALISISPPLMKPQHAGCRETFIEVDTTRQRWRSVLRTVAFCVL